MKQILLSLLAAGALLLQSCSGSQRTGVIAPEEQGGWLIGPLGGVNLVSYSTDQFAILNSEPSCFTAQNGSDVAFHVGISAEIPLDNTMQSFIIAEGIFDSKSSKFTTANTTRATIPTKLNGVVYNGSVETSESASLNYGLINVGYKYNFTQAPSPTGPAAQLCISAGIPLTANLNKTVTVTASSGDASKPDHSETNTAAVPDKQAATATSPAVAVGIRVALRAQFDYDIPLTGDGSWTATPAVGYDFPFTKVDDSQKNWHASAAYAGIAIRYMIR